jgi:hypothetical protein
MGTPVANSHPAHPIESTALPTARQALPSEGAQEGSGMFDQVFDNFKKAAEANIQLQQELFKKWFSLWPGVPSVPAWPEKMQQFQKKWAETVSELLKKQREYTESLFKAGVENLEKAFQFGEVQTPEELRAKTMELWQKCFDSMRQAWETQMADFQMVVSRFAEMMTKSAAA